MEQISGTPSQPPAPVPPGQGGEGLPSDLRVPVGSQPVISRGGPDMQQSAGKPSGLEPRNDIRIRWSSSESDGFCGKCR